MMPFSSRHFRRLLRSGLISGLALWLVLAAGVNSAAAHAELAESNPANGALLDETPEQVWLRFTQELDTSGSSLAVFDQYGQQVDEGDGGVDLNDLDHQRMAVSLPASLANGTYTVRWTAVSAQDGDATSGAISFTVGGPAAAGEAAQGAPSSNPSPLLILAGVVAVVLVVASAITIARRQKIREKVR